MRRGLLGKASIETLSSYPQRTTPTVRGKTMMQIFLGVSPPDPPPNVPPLKDRRHGGPRRHQAHHAAADGNASQESSPARPATRSWTRSDSRWRISTRSGTWRTTDDGSPIDPSGMLVDGTKLDGVKGLREALLRYSPQFVRVITEKLMIYALGRGTEYYDMPLIRSIVRDAESEQLQVFVVGIGRGEERAVPDESEAGGRLEQAEFKSGHRR